MHIIVAKLSAIYTGRGNTILPPHGRIVMQKEDGTITIHSDKGFKPLNYMVTSKEHIITHNDQNELIWIVKGKNEELHITFHEIYNDFSLNLGIDDPGHSTRLGNEGQLQEWLSKNIHLFGENTEFITREHQTGSGPVDLLAMNNENLILVEVKRIAQMVTVSQLTRYLDGMNEKRHNILNNMYAIKYGTEKNVINDLILEEFYKNDILPIITPMINQFMKNLKYMDHGMPGAQDAILGVSENYGTIPLHILPSKGIIAATEIKPRTLSLANKKNIPCISVPITWIDDYSHDLTDEESLILNLQSPNNKNITENIEHADSSESDELKNLFDL